MATIPGTPGNDLLDGGAGFDTYDLTGTGLRSAGTLARDALNSGATPRAGVVLAFSESGEHQARTAANVGGETPDSFGIRFA